MEQQSALTTERIQVLDVIRGFALVGLPYVNILLFWLGQIEEPTDSWNIWLQRGLFFFVEGRFFSIFSFLFGVGFYIFLTRAEAKGRPKYRLYCRRLLLLLAFGIIHLFFQFGRSISLYAVYGFIVLPFFKVPKLVNAIIGIVGVIVLSIVGIKALLPLPLIILGLAVGQYRLFEVFKLHVKKIRLVWLGSGLLTVLSVVILVNVAPESGFMPIPFLVEGGEIPESTRFIQLALAFGPIVSLFYMTTLMLGSKRESFVSKALQPYGKMALTNYLAQTAILLLVLLMLPSDVQVSYSQLIIVCSLLVVFQIVFSILWLRKFRYGH